MAYEDHPPDKLILRDHLAMDRTALANERTLLAYVRTALMLAISGATLLKLCPGDLPLVAVGVALLLFSGVVGVVGCRRFTELRQKIRSARGADQS